MKRRKKNKIRKSIIIISLCICVICIASLLYVKKLYDAEFPRYDRPEYTPDYTNEDIEDEYSYETVSFMSGENRLMGYIYGEENTKGLVILAHGITKGAESYLPQIIYFVDNGWQVFAYDCTGCYGSEGASLKGFPQSALDLDAALTFVESKEKYSNMPHLLFGHSWGGYAVANVLNFNHDVDAAASVSGVNSAIEIVTEQSFEIMGKLANLEVPFVWTYQFILFGKDASLTAVNGINSSFVPTIIIHGTKDTVVPYDGSSIIAHKDEITNEDSEYVTVSTENHNGHSNILYSDEALDYQKEKAQEYSELEEEYNGEIPVTEIKKYYENVDKDLYNEVYDAVMDDVETFFENEISK